MKFQIKEVGQVLEKFGVLNSESKIEQLKKTSPDEFSVVYSFIHNKKTWAIVFNEMLDDEAERVLERSPWPAQETSLIENPTLAGSFGLPFHQKTCYLMARNLHQARLDVVLTTKFGQLSRAKLQKMIKSGQVLVNGTIETLPKKIIDPISDEIALNQTAEIKKHPVEIEVLFENQDLMVINKPAGMLSHATNEDIDGEFSVADFIKTHGDFKNQDYRAGIVHRLDRATSGVMILAKNQATSDYLKAQFKNRQVEKTYYAVVTGLPKLNQAKIDLPMKRSLKNAGKFMVDPSGKQAITVYEITNFHDGKCLVCLKPLTGRTHQLRVHMSYLKLPILGDYLYGGEKFNRLMLHASQVGFVAPDGQKISVKSELPSEFAPWIN